MNRLIARVVAVAGALALSSTLVAPPAQGATKTFDDGNRAGPDITRVKVTNGTKYVTVSVDVGEMIPEDLFTLWLDTVSSNAGPEYKASIRPNTEWERLRRVGSLTSTGTAVAGCWGEGTADIHARPSVVTVKVRRSCMKNPGMVRVSVRGSYLMADGYSHDYAPGKGKFSSWVAKG